MSCAWAREAAKTSGALAVALLGLFARQARAERRPICADVSLNAPERIKLSEVERKLICGDRDTPAWKRIPFNQAEYFLRAFLQQRGYPFPLFTVEGGRLEAETGPKIYITGLSSSGLPAKVRLDKHRKVVGQLLTPDQLNKLKGWVISSLQDNGHGCPRVDVAADARSGEVRVDADPGPTHVVGRVESSGTGNIDPGVLGRYRAFKPGRPLDLRLLNLTSERILAGGQFLSAYYDLSCASRTLTVAQRVVPAPGRLITVGLGVDTEGYARGRVRWTNSRIGPNLSSLQSTVFASYRQQSAEAFMNAYFRPDSRLYLMPDIQVQRQNEPQFEALSYDASLQPAWTRDDQHMRLETRAGPGFEYLRTLRGQGPAGSQYLTFNTRTSLMSHLFEYYLRDPRRGWAVTLETSSRLQGAYSPISAHRLALTAERIWNLGRFDPPSLLLGWRALAGTTWVNSQGMTALPPTLRFFLGGDADLRGFSRKQLPAVGAGFLTAAYQGLELRAGDILPYKIQPLVFIDAAMGGVQGFFLSRTVYWSPGFGVRWGSPMGAFRFTLAHGELWRTESSVPAPAPHWQFFFSFGQEF